MDRAEVEVFSRATNAWVIRTPGRNYPSAVIQGDSLSILLSHARAILDRAQACGDDELLSEAEELCDLLAGHFEHYRSVVREHGFELPFGPPQSAP